MMAGEVTIMGLTVKAGSRRRDEIHIAYMADGQPMVVPFWVINGVKPGKRLLLSACTSLSFQILFTIICIVSVGLVNVFVITYPSFILPDISTFE